MKALIPEHEIIYSAYSVLDGFGKVFFWKEKVFRGLKGEDALNRYNDMVDSGLIARLVDEALFPQTNCTSYRTELFEIVLEHTRLQPLSFVYEWPFDMVKEAARCLIRVNQISAEFGYETVDAHPFNVVFQGCDPIFIDLGSFVPMKDKTKPWRGEGEFHSFYTYPLCLWIKVGHPMARRIYSDPSVLTESEYKLLKGFGTHKSLQIPVKFYRRLKNILERHLAATHSRFVHLKRLANSIDELNAPVEKSAWLDYQNVYSESDVNNTISPRFQYILEKASHYGVKTTTELAANHGVLTYLLKRYTAVNKAICIDYDPGAVNQSFNFFSKTPFRGNVSTLLLDFMRPVELCTGGKPPERFRSQLVIAMAVTHHLTLTQGFDLNTIMDTISGYTSEYVFIEFMPKGLWNGYTAPEIPEWYNQAWFEAAFTRYFDILESSEIEENRILYIGCLKQQSSLERSDDRNTYELYKGQLIDQG